MKKLVAIGVSLMLSIGVLVGCGNSAVTEKQPENSGEKIYNVGIIQFAEHGSLDNCRKGFIEGMKSEGFEEGRNVKYDYQNSQADIAKVNQIAATMVGNNSSLIVGIATPAAQSAYNAAQSKKIPVVFSAISDPYKAGLVKKETDLSVGGVIGTSDTLPVEQQLKMIREILPNAKKIGILYTTSEANSISNLAKYEELAPKYNFEIVKQGISKQADIALALDGMLSKVDCISNMTDNTVVQALPLMLDKANAKKIPVFGSEIEQVQKGCIAAQSLDYLALGKATGVMAAKVLKGEDINTMKLKVFNESELVVNSNVAGQLGVTLSQEVLGKVSLDTSK